MPIAVLRVPWHDPLAALAAVADEPYALALLSDGSVAGRWSYVAHSPAATFSSLADARAALPPLQRAVGHDLPPFQGGLAGLACYEWSGALEPACPQVRTAAWPDLAIGLYTRLLAFDHANGHAWAIGHGETSAGAGRAAREAAGWRPGAIAAASPLRSLVWPEDRRRPYRDDVAAVVSAIVDGELIQANIARTWAGRLDAGRPIDVFRRLAMASPAPFGGYFRLPNLALVSNSPERFIKVTADGLAETKPIKGTRRRGDGAAEDRALAAELLASVKDRAENLMIVDLMRNDLSRFCRIGSIKVDPFCALESFANVHHLVSTVHGRLREGASALDLFAGAFPPGSVTGCPKLQAMTVIARHERPRGPYCGSLFWFGFDGAFDSNVLIRTLAFENDETGWRFEARAGAGITADSDPDAEDAEAEAKIGAITRALTWT